MKRPSDLEEAALVAASSLCDTKTTRRKKRPAKTTAETWDGWHFRDDELIDGGGNRYGQSEIRAIFYT